MLKKILLTLLLAIAALAVVIQLRHSDFSITRSATIAAAPDVVFPHVNELKKWEAWNPWGKMDPDAKMTYAGPPAGAGASYSWASSKGEIGEGTNTITESKPNELVRFKLEFTKPMAAVNDTTFTFKPEGANTVVTWTMSGKNGFIGKAFSLFVDCDKMIGGEFEKGLASMKSAVEGAAKK
jgi:hypothetical protein